MARNKTTFLGLGTYDEMCYTLLAYYPKENINDIRKYAFCFLVTLSKMFKQLDEQLNTEVVCHGQYHNEENHYMCIVFNSKL